MSEWGHVIIGETLDDSDPRLQSIILNGETVRIEYCDLTLAPLFAAYVIDPLPKITMEDV